MKEINCHAMGIAGTTRGFVRRVGDQYVARIGVAIMGATNRPVEELATASPFDEDFRDNYAEGRGHTHEEAVAALRRDVQGMAESLWL